MATQKKAASKKGMKVRDLKPSKDAKGGGGRNLDGSRSADGSRGLNSSRSADGGRAVFGAGKGLS